MPRAPKKSVSTEHVTAAQPVNTFFDDNEKTDDWFADEQYDGQLAVDVYQTSDSIIIKAAIAGVEPDDLDIAAHRDIVTIRGRRRRQEQIDRDDYLFQECYWGSFSRSIILPVEVDPDGVTASIKSGILRVTLPKAKVGGPRQVRVRNEDDAAE